MTTAQRARSFTRDDGLVIAVIDGFRDTVLSAPRVSVQPKPEWTDADYSAAAEKKILHADAFINEFASLGGRISGARLLEVGCGAGIDCLLMATRNVRHVAGIDMSLPLFESGDKGDRTRRLLREVEQALGQCLDTSQMPVSFSVTDARRMSFPDNSFDLLWTRAAMEHIVPPENALLEMARVVRPGGLMYHSIDPFFWLKGCHKGGLTDIPWAHARLTSTEYRRALEETSDKAKAEKCSNHLRTLNQLTPREWRRTIEAGPFEILDWKEETSPLAESLLSHRPDVLQTILPGLRRNDLTCSQIKVWLRNL
jgi:ubiquinone/menaquinone biosynthesis C-methylase UbiE